MKLTWRDFNAQIGTIHGEPVLDICCPVTDCPWYHRLDSDDARDSGRLGDYRRLAKEHLAERHEKPAIPPMRLNELVLDAIREATRPLTAERPAGLIVQQAKVLAKRPPEPDEQRPAPSDAAARYTAAAALLDELPVLIRERMRARGISYRTVATEAGIASNSSVHRVAYGHGAHTDTATALLRWLARPTPTEELP